MTPRKRQNILLADDGSQHAQAAVAWLQNISFPAKSDKCFRAFQADPLAFCL